MATYEKKGRMTYKDENGDKYVLYPVTKKECVEGIEEFANKTDIPTKLPNPYSLTINGTNYDGSSDVNITLDADAVGADATGTASAAVSAHNTNTAAHDDIRLLIDGLTTRLNAMQVPHFDSDWNAAEGESGHILNRTHWVETTVGEAILEETTLTASEDDPGYFEVTQTITMEVGKTYAIVYNGTTYTCTAMDATEFVGEDAAGLICCGNYPLLLGTGDTGEPFVLACVSGVGCMIFALDNIMSATFAIYSVTETVHKLDNKFIDAEWMATTATAWEKGTVLWEEQETRSIHSNVGFLLTAGSTYVVVYDGVEYILDCKTLPGYTDALYLGNPAFSAIEGASNTGEPFFLASVCDEGTYLLVAAYADVTGTHIVGIYEANEVKAYVKLPEEFLPEGYGKDELVAAVIAALPNAEGASF